MEAIDWLRKRFNVPKDKTLTEVRPPFECWHDIVGLMNEFSEDEIDNFQADFLKE